MASEQKANRLKWALLVVAILFVLAGLIYVVIPVPFPDVKMRFEGYKVIGTNTFAVMTVTNGSPTRVVLDDRWRLDEGTFMGGKETSGTAHGLIGLLPEYSSRSFELPISQSTTQWFVNLPFSYQKHRSPTTAFSLWLDAKGVFTSAPKSILRLARRLDGEFEEATLGSLLVTNLPPSGSNPP
jgi:hypothetical protein